jgi:hypothetical protein
MLARWQAEKYFSPAHVGRKMISFAATAVNSVKRNQEPPAMQTVLFVAYIAEK